MTSPPSRSYAKLTLVLVAVALIIGAPVYISLLAARTVAPVSTTHSGSTSGLQLTLGVRAEGNGSYGIEVQELNTMGAPNKVAAVSHWPLVEDGLYPFAQYHCNEGYSPIGLEVLQGNYGLNNFSDGVSLSLFDQVQTETCHMTTSLPPSYWVFNASSSFAVGDTLGGENITLSISLSGYWTGETFHGFQGEYTVVAADEWGAVEIAYFSVV